MAGYVRVSVPREFIDKYWPLPWLEVIHAAEAHEDGLEVLVHEAGQRAKPDFALLRQGVGEMFDSTVSDWGKNRTLLFSQGW